MQSVCKTVSVCLSQVRATSQARAANSRLLQDKSESPTLLAPVKFVMSSLCKDADLLKCFIFGDERVIASNQLFF